MANNSGNNIIRQMIVLGDFLLLNALLLFFLKVFKDYVPPVMIQSTRIFFFINNVSLLVGLYITPPIIHERHIDINELITRIFRLTLFQALSMFVFFRLLYNTGELFRFMLIYTPSLFVSLITARIVERFIINTYRQHGGNSRSVVLVGNDPALLLVYNELASNPARGYRIKGYYADNELKNCPKQIARLGTLDDLAAKMQSNDIKFGIDELFCCLSHDENEKIMSIMRFCDTNFIKFYYVPRMIGNYNLNLKPEKFGSIHLFTNHTEPLRSFGNRLLKRSFDVVVSSLTCIVMLPFLPIIALIIKHQSPGPLLFKQKRTGMNGETFTCYKFRSMHVNKAADTQQATQDDPRKFPFGNFMRKSNLDEFPQFFNVLIGNMSIVGPRPHMLLHTEVYSEQIGRYMVRHFCKPGITGWAQVTGFRGETKELWQMEERIRRDIWYIENWSFSLDLHIIFMTFTSIFKHDKNAY